MARSTRLARIPLHAWFLAAGLIVAASISSPAWAGEWKTLEGLDAWRGKPTGWEVVGGVALKSGEERRLVALEGTGVIHNGPTGRGTNLVSREEFQDVELHAEFLVPKGSNSGIKFEGVYEIQIHDSHGVGKVNGTHCGGVYPRAELLPRYKHIDEGFAPRINACKPPGEWQSIEAVFRAPRFDAAGKKIANARFDVVKLNGQVIHEALEVPTPTGHIWRQKEEPRGPILLQGDHGAVAFRNIRARPLDEKPRRDQSR